MPPSTIPSIFNDISSPDPRCENSEPMLPRNGKALSQVLALGAHLLRCRDKAVPRYCCPATIFRDPGTDTDIISAQHFWTGGLETDGPGCYDAVAIGSVVEPEVFEARVIVDAVDHCNKPLELWLPAIRSSRIKQDRPCVVFGQFAFDLPYQPLSLLHIAHVGLLIDHFVDVGLAVAGIVALGPAHIVLVKGRVGIVDRGFGDGRHDITDQSSIRPSSTAAAV